MKKVLIMFFLTFILLIFGGCKNSLSNQNINTENNNDLSNNENRMIKQGDVIKVDYIGKTLDGKIFDTSIESIAKESNLYDSRRPYQPIQFTVGGGQMIKGFDNGVVGMKNGETKTINISPKDGYGEKNPDYEFKIMLGETKQIGNDSIKFVEKKGDNALLDFNHFLAGEKLNIEIELIKNNTNSSKEVVNGDEVLINYTLKLGNGNVIDSNIKSIAQSSNIYNSSRPYEPLQFTVGRGQLIKGFDEGVLGMKEGEKKVLEILPIDGFGEKNENLIKEYSLGSKILVIQSGQPTIIDIGKDYIILDFNHYLAGKDLVFEVTIREIN